MTGQPIAPAAETKHMDLVNMPLTFDHEGNETAWRQGLPPGDIRQQLSGLDLSDIDSDNDDTSILGMCLNSFKRDNWIPDAKGVHNDMQVGEADRVNDPADIP